MYSGRDFSITSTEAYSNGVHEGKRLMKQKIIRRINRHLNNLVYERNPHVYENLNKIRKEILNES